MIDDASLNNRDEEPDYTLDAQPCRSLQITTEDEIIVCDVISRVIILVHAERRTETERLPTSLGCSQPPMVGLEVTVMTLAQLEKLVEQSMINVGRAKTADPAICEVSFGEGPFAASDVSRLGPESLAHNFQLSYEQSVRLEES